MDTFHQARGSDSHAAVLASRFGVEMSKGYTFDKENSVAGTPSHLIFSRENKLLNSHPITEGRGENERVRLENAAARSSPYSC